MKKLTTVLFLAFTLFFCGCTTHQKLVQTDLYFGLSKSDGGMVSDSAWNGFVEREVSTVFPSGFTVLVAEGKWRDEQTGQLTGEPSRVVVHLHKSDKNFSARIDSLRERYKRLFGQQSVLRVDRKVRANF